MQFKLLPKNREDETHKKVLTHFQKMHLTFVTRTGKAKTTDIPITKEQLIHCLQAGGYGGIILGLELGIVTHIYNFIIPTKYISITKY